MPAIQFISPLLHEFTAAIGNLVFHQQTAKPLLRSYKLTEIGIYLHLFPPRFAAVIGEYLIGFAPVSATQIDENSFFHSPLRRTHWF